MKQFLLSVLICCLVSDISIAQVEKVFQTFKDTRVINTHSIETLKAGKMDIRISHRFGDIAGNAGGWPNFYGLESATDISIGVEYGFTDKIMAGINRAKGSGPLKQNLNGLVKIKLINQEINGNQPLSLTIFGLATYSTMQKSQREGVLHFFEKGAHRMSYHLQGMLARKFSDYFSLQLGASWTYRNLVPSNDVNDLVSISAAMRIQISKSMGLIFDGTFPFSELRQTEIDYLPALGVGLEWETGGGHVFQLNFTNATGLSETDYIPYTQANWLDGEYRFGFTISRLFSI